ncbi:hypothetical protein J4H92_06635 [Leucobacter weissii]|uniref:Uncharacterized protein n=1 Tax=Leucobacter weissii TaxID=1983706 RepID=A0A939MN49_9MICO|nr:hypothetical protein [Leucobacter weissii]MBO1901627.1 hypothetical protein [Leucobacter weissii]
MLKTSTKAIGLTAAAVLALTLGAVTPATAAVKPTFGNVSASNPGSVTVPSGSAKTKRITVKFDGPAAPSSNPSQITYGIYGADFYGPKIKLVKKNKGVKSRYVYTPSVSADTTSPTPAAGGTVSTRIWSHHTPGRYKVTIPVTQHDRRVSPTKNTTRSTTKYLTIKANTKVSRKSTSISGSGRTGKTWRVTVNAPNYQAGAKVTLYAKKKGAKKYKRVASGKLKSTSSSYSKTSKLKLPGKYTKKGSRAYVKVGSVTYAAGYKSSPQKVR